MKFEINNFAGMSPVRVEFSAPTVHGPLVYLLQSVGSMNFQHSMTPTQARQMADALVHRAKEAEDEAINAEFAAHRAALEVAA